ncbi:T9SS type A sorting domain-containing protein [Fluviicola sp.]|uniref:fibronectin type III domain-containing protein n=1 Tax=Fluviicola sp. TaxID=1917219 RepID=UPI002617BB24|nr:T9SS type A sorting domain-containing protein [Fluviicola sp.]
MKKNYKQPLLGVMFALGIFSVSNVHSQVDLTATGGTTTATYTTVSAAFAAVNAGTHTGTISISITGNTTEPAAPVALSANGVGTASFASLAIKPTVATIISGAPGAGSGVLNFSGSDNVTIDGSITPGGTTKDLTIQNTNAASFTNTAVIRLIGQTTAGTGLALSNFVIKNNILIGNTPGNNGTSGSSVSSSYGIYAGANNATTMPSGTSGADYDNVLVENNDIKKAYIGINFYGAAANQNDNLIIRRNTIGSTTAADQIGYKGIIAYNTLIGSISNNTISNIQLNTSVSTAGIEVGGTSDNVKISSNVISSIYSTSTSGYGSYGINIEGGNNYIVDNNSISDIKTLNYSATSQTYNAFGIRLNGGTGHKIYYNSVHLSGNYSTGSTVAASAALAVALPSVTNLDIRNNIFSNVMTSTATGAKEFSAVWFASGYNFTNASLNNNYYGITNDAIHLVGKIGTTSGTGNYLNLNTWRAISQVNNVTNDVNSAPISNTPAPFTSNTNLLPLTTVPTAIESGALAIASLGAPNLDITGATRPGTGTNPDMGAYEFSGMTITCPQPLSITVQSATNSNANVTWTSAGSETSWQLQYGPQGFALGSGTTVLTTTNPGTISGLTTHSFYQVYVRAICGAGDTSLWTGPATFNTYNQAPFMEWRSDCPTAGFIDIATTGTDLNLTDDSEQGMTLPFPILYQGALITTCNIGNNGGIALGTTTADVVPSPGNMNSLTGSFIYPWGDDLDDESGNVYQQTIGTAPNRTFIVQWDNICNYSGSATAPTVTFQVQIDEATGKIWFVYDDVVFGAPNAADDYGANADIGISGPIQDFNVSNDNAAYLQNNTCVEFFYTDCPKPKNVVTTFLSAEEITFGWTAGLAAETAWIIEYGPAGFTPGTGTIINTTNSFATITGLTQVTNYTLYIYAHCANGDTSLALNHNFTTLPRCSNPTTLGGTAAPDSLKLTWAWTPSSIVYPAQSFKIQYGMTGFPLYSVPTVTANGTNLADTIYDANLMASGVYQYYVQAVCLGGDTSSFAGPFTIRMPLTNDLVCAPELLQLNRTYTFDNAGATVSTGEASIAPPATGAQTTTGWANSTLDGTLWYTFVAPPSGSVRVNATAISYNGQAAVYAVANCANFSTFTLKAANDDAIGGGSSAPNFTVCGLTPGTTYYIMYDKYSSTSGNFSLNVSPIVLEAGIINPASQITNVCTGDTVNLFNTIINYNTGGTWSSSIPAVNISLQDSLFISSGLAYQTFNLQYRVTEGCAYDSIVSQVRIFKPSNAGQDGIVTACKNEPIDLLAGLNGNTDLNGDWYDTQNSLMPNSQITTANFPGQYNYDYVSGNGVCPDDTAMVIVSVQNCNWLSVEENALEEVSIYPNPSTGLVYIESTFATGSFNLTVTDINGRTIQTGTKSISLGTNAIDLKEVERGTYLFKLSSDSAEKVFRIVIQ